MKNYSDLWLGYKKKTHNRDCKNLNKISFTGVDETDAVAVNASEELKTGLKTMLDIEPEIVFGTPGVTGTVSNGSEILDNEEYRISLSDGEIVVEAKSGTGILYGAFDILRTVAVEKDVIEAYGKGIVVRPSNPLRMLNHWDKMNGDIERGYSGESFFFADNEIVINERTRDYARLIASVGINAVVINNVNVKDAASYMITDRYYDKLAELGEIFAGYGIRLFLSLNYASTIEIGGLDSADPLDEKVIAWWRTKMAEVFDRIPTLGGFLVKADSEGRPGPFTYGRTQADGANMLADIVKEYGGIIVWRCFVYNCKQDWRDEKTDRAKSGYDYFHSLDGKFEENVILQIKNGPMDFQVREPISPLFGGMENTNQMLEVQIAQEYTGQQRHVCFLIPWFKEILAFNTHMKEASVADIVSGRVMGNKNAGMTAVCNTGDDYNWTGHDLAGANLYGFGKLAFDTSLSATDIAANWARLYLSQAIGESSFAKRNGEKIVNTVKEILMKSWPVYEKYNAPLGIGWMVVPGIHYGPDVDGYEYSPWGTYHKADLHAIGRDRTDNGTGYVSQYREENKKMYENVETCPEELLLFFHRLPYNYVLKNGKTVIQHIYDTHFEGAEEAAKLMEEWKSLEGLISKDVYERTLERFTHQAEHSKEWRDVINSYFFRKTGIKDLQGREIY